MSSYFDTWARDVLEAGNIEDNAAFLARVTEIEKSRVAEINLVTGDREFPCVMRENIQGLIAQWSLGGPLAPTSAAREYVLTVRASRLEQELHTAFHTVAEARIETRFGVLNDNPTCILYMRDEYALR